MRIILYTGKGGVGKTTISAATACKIAEEGKKVLIMSTDAAHSLSDSFDIKLGDVPVKIGENLYGMEIDTVKENEEAWNNISEYMKELLTIASGETIEVEELLVFPGLQELLALMKIKEFEMSGEYDVLIVDCAPTGETMSLLKFPELFKNFMEKVFPMKKKATKYIGPIVEKTVKVPMPKEEVMEDIERLYGKLEELHILMLDREKTSIRIVTTPEKIVVTEAKRSFSFLHLFDYNVDGIFINRIFPKESIKGYFEKWEKNQNEGIKEIQESFNEIPIFKLELKNKELRKYEFLSEVGKELYGDLKPEKVLFNRRIFEVTKEEEKDVLKVYMSVVNKEELQLLQKGDELIIGIKNERRSIILPNRLKGKEVVAAKYKDKSLNIYFDRV